MSAIRQTLPQRAPTPTPELLELPARPSGVQLRARRSTRLIVIGVLCVCVGALASAWAWNQGQESQPVVLIAKDVARGQQIQASDLTTTNLGRAAGVSVVPASEADSLIGQYARTDLPAGSLPGADSVGEQAVAPGMTHVGLRLASGRLPAQPMPAGTRVLLVAVPGPMDDSSGPGAQFEAIIVTAPQATTDGGSYLVDVQVDESIAASVAALAAQERLAMVRKADS